MKIRDLLNSHTEINNAINSKLEQIAELKELATRITSTTFSESHSKGTYNDRVGRTTARIIDLENEINEEIDRLVEIKIKIRDLVSSLSDPNLRIVLERRYILGENWEKIAEKMGYSPRHISRMHNRAVEMLEKGCIKEIA